VGPAVDAGQDDGDRQGAFRLVVVVFAMCRTLHASCATDGTG